MKDKVDITGMTWIEVMALVNCSKTTAKNALKRGYYVVNYKKRTCPPGPIDAGGCYKMAWVTFERFFRHHCPWNIAPEDCVQEAVLRLVELGGHARAGERRFQFYTGKHAIGATSRSTAGQTTWETGARTGNNTTMSAIPSNGRSRRCGLLR
jgi:hypothetical protein